MMTLLNLILGAALSGAPANAPSQPDRALKLVSAACPNAVSEEVEACAYKLVATSDRRIRALLCRRHSNDCARAAAAFTHSRNGLVQAYLTALDDSVVSRVDAALFALDVTSSFERRLRASS
jgi:hypothetical protein